jgi:hypothetical protein
MRANSRMNQGSNFEASWISSTLMPARSASATTRARSGFGVASAVRSVVWSVMPRSSSPAKPVSSPRRPFWKASAKLRPIAMVSPTDFMEVVSVAGVPGNFSKVKRGIFTTT